MGTSTKMNEQLAQSWWLILISVASGVAGQTSLKIGLSRAGGDAASDTLFSLIGLILRSPLVLGGLFLYAMGAIAWIAVLRRMDLSYAYPFLALNFVLIALVSQFVLGETVPWIRWVGIGAIVAGILLIAGSGVTQ
jgi:drug/metabolite transporter (DMT)-like permease